MWYEKSDEQLASVVPYVGTWIEIEKAMRFWELIIGRSLRGNVDRNKKGLIGLGELVGRSLRGNVDRNANLMRAWERPLCRSLRGNVDRNIHVAVLDSDSR